ncbi:MAG: maltose alpha-D-glucosyltransferase, partial [Bryobacteraceae bacterium]
ESELDEPRDLIELSERPPSQLARDHVGLYLESAVTLGRRTGEMHRALASHTDDPAFAPEPLTAEDAQGLTLDWREQATAAFGLLKENLPRLPDEAVETAALVLGRRREILDRLRVPHEHGDLGLRIRIHGDYHLGQVLRAKGDYIILDFEGEPSRPLRERRNKQSALKDIAGMLRSFSYGAYSTLLNWTARHGEDFARMEPWARLWERSAAAEFLRGYREAAGGAEFLPAAVEDFRRLLRAHRLSKALNEIVYELNNRPAWVRVPLIGILSFPL